MNQYKMLKDKHFKELNNFPFFISFNDIGIAYGLLKIGLKATDTDKITRLNHNVIVKSEDVSAWKEMITRHRKEINNSIKNDKDGTGFIYDMFLYELNNHEYLYTREVDATLESLGYTKKQIESNLALKNGLNLAIETLKQKEKEQEESGIEY